MRTMTPWNYQDRRLLPAMKGEVDDLRREFLELAKQVQLMARLNAELLEKLQEMVRSSKL